MNGITIFNHLGNDIRVMTDEQGEPWFVLKDICDALEIGNSRNLGVRQETLLVNEAGLYEVIIRWVTSEVLPLHPQTLIPLFIHPSDTWIEDGGRETRPHV